MVGLKLANDLVPFLWRRLLVELVGLPAAQLGREEADEQPLRLGVLGENDDAHAGVLCTQLAERTRTGIQPAMGTHGTRT
jgi:hypothetical protein